MNDFEYDSYLKKNIANSARRRKIGSKSKSCHLSTDYMTHKEWKERCGSIMSYNIGKPMNWNEFCRLPKDLKEEYINTLIEKYSVNIRYLSDMFGVSPATLSRLVKKESLSVEFTKGRHPSGAQLDLYKKFLTGEVDEAVGVIDEVYEDETNILFQQEDEKSDNKTESVDSNATAPHLDCFTLNFSGRLDVNMIANSLRYIIGDGASGKVEIRCEMD